MRHAVIMAGGAGTRLWPLSRRRRPKHFLKMVEGRSLMRIAYERLAHWMAPEQINIITSAAHIDLVAAELPEVPRENLIGEPAVRDTANAVGLAAVLLEQRDADGTMGVFTADHVIQPVDHFAASLQRAYDAAERYDDALVTIGVTPSSPHTGYGYVKRGAALSNGVFEVEQFKEKPDLQTAQTYVDSGDYFWNSGMFVWRLATMLEQFHQHLPDNHRELRRVGQAGPGEQAEVIAAVYPNLHKTSIDYGVMEKAARVVVAEMDCTWLDIGAWTALGDVLGRDAQGCVTGHANVLHLDTTNTVVVGEDEHLVATIGLQDCVIVRSEDATLICHKDHVQKIKDLVGRLDDRYL